MERQELVKRIDQAVEGLTDELVQFACTIFGIPTQNPPGNNYRECTQAIGDMMREIGMDVEYVDHVTFVGDVKIILGTVLKAFVKREGINSETAATMEEFKGTVKSK